MKVIQCENGHFYDCDKFQSCPHCGKTGSNIGNTPVSAVRETKSFSVYEKKDDQDDNRTVLLTTNMSTGSISHQPVVPERKASYPVNKELINGNSMFKRRYVVGWIVCIRGELLGSAFNIYKGKNTIGSSMENVIVLTGANGIAPVEHISIAFDANKNFFVLPGYGEALVNGIPFVQPKFIRAKDIISIGNGNYMFVPLHSNDFDWDMYLER